MRTRPASIAIAIVVGVAVVMVVFGAAVRGPWVVSPGSLLSRGGDSVPTVPPEVAPTHTPPPSDQVKEQWDASWLPAALSITAIVAGLVVMFLLARMIFRAIGRARVPDAEAERVRGGALVSPAELPHVETLRKGVESAQASLDDVREPGDAVIAAWIALEASAESSGVARKPAQTPTEFTVRVLSTTSADPDAVDDLLSLYLVARFSTHRVTSSDVERASACLTRIAATLAVERVAP